MDDNTLAIEGDFKDGILTVPSASMVDQLVSDVNLIKQRLEERERSATEMVSKMEAMMKQMETLKSNYEQTREIEKETFSKLQSDLNLAQQDLRARLTEAQRQVDSVAQMSSSASQYTNQINQLLANASNDGKAIIDMRSRADEEKVSIEKTFADYAENGRKKLELDSVYEKTAERFKKSESALSSFERNAEDRLTSLTSNADAKIKEYCDRIEDLFGGALSVGLGESYHKKCEEEKTSHAKYTEQFNWALLGILVVAVIAGIIHLIVAAKNDYAVSWNSLRFMSALTVPILAPILWFAFTSSRKANLAKRLAEEYAHKEVVSKTYVGLVRQIKNLGEGDDQSRELLVKLLKNAVSVNERNAGELIKGYNQPDHPLLELVERVKKFDNDGMASKILSSLSGQKK